MYLNSTSRSRAGLALAVSALLLPSVVLAQSGAAGTQGDTSNNTSLAVKLLSHDRAQTGTATLTQVSGAVQVHVVLDQAPVGAQTAMLVRGSCPALAGTSSSGSMSSSSGDTSSSMNGSPGGGVSSNMNPEHPGSPTSPSPDSMKSGSSGSMSSGGGSMSAKSYQIGKVTASQGGQGQTTGVAATTIKGVTLSGLTAGTYAIIVGSSPTTSGAALCGDLKSSLPPMTPAGSQ